MKREKRVVEIRAGEGGADARLFVAELAGAYSRLARVRGWSFREVSRTDGTFVAEMAGPGVGAMSNEAGGHRIQRIPPTERKGRVHSSTVTVAVLDPDMRARGPWEMRSPGDFSVEWYSGTGAGGQNRNKVMASCRLVHGPTGLVRSAQTRSREDSRRHAMEALLADLDTMGGRAGDVVGNGERRAQVGLGERADRRRTWVFRRDEVTDHLTGRSLRCQDAMAGGLDALWE